MRLIDIEPFEKCGDAEIHFEYSDTTGYCESVETKDIPTVEPKKGKWIDKHETILGGHQFACSLCKVTFGFNIAVGKYCPNCGAKMEVEDERMTIDEIKEEMCDHYCRFVYKCKTEEELEEKYCSECPLNWLEDD